MRTKANWLIICLVFLCSSSVQAQKKVRRPDSPSQKLEQGALDATGKRVGKWNFYTASNELELTFDYDSSRINFLQPDTTRYLVRVGEQWQLKRPTRAPHLLGSTDQRLRDLSGTMHYPVSALRQQLQGKVLLSYTVSPDGHTHDYVVENSLNQDCDQEVWRALKTLPDSWIPAVYHGRPTASRFYLAVEFKIMSEFDARRLQTSDKRRSAPPAAGVSLAPTRPRYTHEAMVIAVWHSVGGR